MKEYKNKTGYVGMCADILHVGHIRLLKAAAEVCDYLVVGLLTDEAIAEYKNPPLMPYEERAEIIESIYEVDEVIPQKTLDYTHNLLQLKPGYVIHADDWKTGVQAKTREQVIKTLSTYGGILIEPPYTKGISSTMLKNRAGIYDKESV